MTCRGHQSYVVDHSGLSLSGHMSDRARRAWRAREVERMEACAARDEAGRLACPDCQAAAQRTAEARRVTLAAAKRSQAADLRRYAAAGMRPKAHRTLADRLEAEAAELEQADRYARINDAHNEGRGPND